MITSPSIRVLLVPIGSFPLEQAMELARILPERFPIEMEFHVVIWSLTPPLEMYDWERGQFRADELAEYLADSIPLAEPPRLLILGLSDADAYVDGLNFVFGIALPRRGVAIVFSRRLYSASREVYFKRLVKECM
ncbi:MAG: peptidase M54, partial [Desulfurococcales archaeon]|nr:peptidase M54 [Desulfurococcales archaeon]